MQRQIHWSSTAIPIREVKANKNYIDSLIFKYYNAKYYVNKSYTQTTTQPSEITAKSRPQQILTIRQQ